MVLFSVLYHLSIACLNKFCLLSTTNLASKTRWSFFEMCIGPIEMTMILPRLILAFSLRGRYIQVSYIYIYIKLRLYSFIKKKRLENWSSTPLDWEIHKFKNKLLICLLRALWSVIIRWSVGSGHCVWGWTSQIPSPLVHVHGRLGSHPELSL